MRNSLVGRIGLWPFLTVLVLYNQALLWGFLNYLFTAGLALGAFAGWIASRDRAAWPRIAAVIIWAAVLFCVLRIWHVSNEWSAVGGNFVVSDATLDMVGQLGLLQAHR